MVKSNKDLNRKEEQQIQDNDERKVILLMGMGLNGISAGGWIPLADDEIQLEMIDDMWTLLESVDTYIMGRVTYQQWEKYWPEQANKPSSSDFQKKYSIFVDQIQKLVFSTTLKTANWQNSRVIHDNISTEIARIKKLPGKNIVIVGGAGIAQTFTKLNLIDEYQLYIHPAIFEPGKSIFGVLDKELQLELIDTKNFLPSCIRLHFRTVK